MNTGNGSASVQDEIKQAVKDSGDVQEAVRRVTIKALTQGELDGKSVRKVTAEVIKGVQEGAAAYGASVKDTTAKAVAGLDEALAHAAQAIKLSLEEATDRAEKFSREDLAKTRENLKNLEKLFVDTLSETAKAGRGAASSILDDIARHAQASGTAVGRQVAENMSGLSERAAEAGRAQFEAGLKAAAASGAMMARIASGVLSGIADSLAQKSKSAQKSKGRST